jgi:hypothetical protein
MDSCPTSCPLKNSCYAKRGRLFFHWYNLSHGRLKHNQSWKDFLGKIKSLPDGCLWRHNQAGDLAGVGNHINMKKLVGLVAANKGKKGYTYTHKPLNNHNKKAIAYANRNGFTINLSANGFKDIDKLAKQNIGPVVSIMPSDFKGTAKTSGGNKVVLCPAMNSGDHSVTCSMCGLCQKVDRKMVIGFAAHGASKKKIDQEFFAGK